MPAEFRRLTFHYQELPEAMETCGDKLAREFDHGSVAAIATETIDGDFHYSFEIFDAAKGKARRASVPESVVQDALVEFCGKLRIPLPRDSQKIVRTINGKLCLDIQIGVAEVEPDDPQASSPQN